MTMPLELAARQIEAHFFEFPACHANWTLFYIPCKRRNACNASGCTPAWRTSGLISGAHVAKYIHFPMRFGMTRPRDPLASCQVLNISTDTEVAPVALADSRHRENNPTPDVFHRACSTHRWQCRRLPCVERAPPLLLLGELALIPADEVGS
jgi:hypothetical protein